ncbi:hypothetical protein BD410DRAFT_257488 [Rickenella mellea]|uniref:F-box domain-containing protein n=1 Tax=Rickenella mellea TaxID=50990 RepID=A0A4Y7Q421_9AGAM|nr:hypothetical protein BD410DRAFT_257488 [Rickenella mellea]
MSQSPLLHDVLRVDTLERRLAAASLQLDKYDSDDELINVVSLPGTPARSHPPSRHSSRPPSPTKGASARPLPGPLHLALRRSSSDPLRILPTELGQRVFGHLSIRDLARCARVCKKWCGSQTLNYVWFQNHRKDSFQDADLPPGKWTRRESKQNWSLAKRSLSVEPIAGFSTRSSTPTSAYSGYQTPREIREEQWRMEGEAASKPSKVEMREIYKELGGRKVRGKGKITPGGIRDRGGWDADGDDGDM